VLPDCDDAGEDRDDRGRIAAERQRLGRRRNDQRERDQAE